MNSILAVLLCACLVLSCVQAPAESESANCMRSCDEGKILDKQNGEHSGTVTIRPGDQPATIVDISAEDTANPPGLVFAWDMERISTPFGALSHQVFLDLAWGTKKAAFTATVDAKKGGRVFLAATALKVTTRYERGALSGPTFQISGTAVYGSADTPRPTRTIISDPVGPGGVAFFGVPKYAEDVVVMPDDNALLAGPTFGDVRWARDSVLFLAAAQSVSFGAATPRLPVPNAAEFCVINNTTAGDVSYTLVFGLNL